LAFVISLTTIPPRFATLPRVIKTLWAQDARPDRIILTVPKTYRRFQGNHPLPDLPGVEVLRPEADPGPAGKALTAAQHLRGQACKLLYCDDDWHYGPGGSAGFLEAAGSHPDDVLCASGYDVGRLGLGKRDNARPERRVSDIAQGFAGVLIQPDMLDDVAFEMPELAWAVDDVYLSATYARLGLGIRQVSGLREMCTPLEDPGNLQDATIGGESRKQANQRTANYLAEQFGIWGSAP